MINLESMQQEWSDIKFLPKLDITLVNSEDLELLNEIFTENEATDIEQSIVLYRIMQRRNDKRAITPVPMTREKKKLGLETYLTNVRSELTYFGEVGLGSYRGVALYLHGELITRMSFAKLGV